MRAKHRNHPLKTALVSVGIAGLVTGVGVSTAMIAGAFSASAATAAKTYIANRPDSGNGGTWAYDDFTRTLAWSTAPAGTCQDYSGTPSFNTATDTCYTAQVTDTGKSNAIVGDLAPNQVTAGVKIKNAVQATENGTGSYIFYAPNADVPTASNVSGYENDNFADPTGVNTTSNWFEKLFTSGQQPSVVGSLENTWSWTYTTGCEKWVDAASNGSGDLSGDGNITGITTCVVSHNGPGEVVNSASGKCLNITNGAYVSGGTVNQYTCNATWHGKVGGAQQFEYFKRNNGTGYLVAISPDNGSMWYVNSSVKGAQLTLSQFYNANADIVVSGAYYTFPNTGLVADNSGFSKSNLTKIIGWPLNDGTNQRFTLP